MADYPVHENPNPKTKAGIPYLLDVQSGLLSQLGTRVVVPLYRPEAGVQALSRLTPVVSFHGESLVVMVPELAGLHRRQLGPVCGDLASARAEILQALDLLLTGF